MTCCALSAAHLLRSLHFLVFQTRPTTFCCIIHQDFTCPLLFREIFCSLAAGCIQRTAAPAPGPAQGLGCLSLDAALCGTDADSFGSQLLFAACAATTGPTSAAGVPGWRAGPVALAGPSQVRDGGLWSVSRRADSKYPPSRRSGARQQRVRDFGSAATHRCSAPPVCQRFDAPQRGAAARK